MTRQPNLFTGFADTRARQPSLFAGQPVESERQCAECGKRLIETASGYLCCPAGHGKLVPDCGQQCSECGAALALGAPVVAVKCRDCSDSMPA